MNEHVCSLPSCWGWGAKMVKGMPKGWKCPGCGKKDTHACVMPDGLTICGLCAHQLHLEAAG